MYQQQTAKGQEMVGGGELGLGSESPVVGTVSPDSVDGTNLSKNDHSVSFFGFVDACKDDQEWC